jgi:hypothetical protein
MSAPPKPNQTLDASIPPASAQKSLSAPRPANVQRYEQEYHAREEGLPQDLRGLYMSPRILAHERHREKKTSRQAIPCFLRRIQSLFAHKFRDHQFHFEALLL